MSEEKDILKFVTIGSVDDGKSTLIGRLLYETDCVFMDQYEAIKNTSEKKGFDNPDLSLITDGLKSEREQGITIDVAYRYFATDKRKFIVSDCPGHVQYTKNMITGASNAEVSLIILDAKRGITEQSKRHGFISSLLQISHTLVVVNKMDMVDYSEDVFNDIVAEYKEFLSKLDIKDVVFIPSSALKGDNIVNKTDNLSWHEGTTVLSYLENVYVLNAYNKFDFRFPVQMVIRDDPFRGYAGDIASGTVRVGDEVLLMPSMKKSKISAITTYEGSHKEASQGSVVLSIEDDIDVSRGDMISKTVNVPHVDNSIDAMLCWFDSEPLDMNKKYLLKHTTNITKATISEFKYIIDVNTLHRTDKQTMEENDIGRFRIETFNNIFFDPYKMNKATGSFVLIDEDSCRTVAAGFITARSKDKNIRWEDSPVSKEDREKRNGHTGKIVWMTGFSGSGKTTIAKEVEKKLFNTNHQVIVLDGDNIRHGLCNDLDFSEEDRDENLRRVGEVAKILADNGSIVICSFVSPSQSQRDFVRMLAPEDEFKEVYVRCPIEICEQRDVKGLYKKFRDGEILDLTGLGSPYEIPVYPELIVDTSIMSLKDCIDRVMEII